MFSRPGHDCLKRLTAPTGKSLNKSFRIFAAEFRQVLSHDLYRNAVESQIASAIPCRHAIDALPLLPAKRHDLFVTKLRNSLNLLFPSPVKSTWHAICPFPFKRASDAAIAASAATPSTDANLDISK